MNAERFPPKPVFIPAKNHRIGLNDFPRQWDRRLIDVDHGELEIVQTQCLLPVQRQTFGPQPLFYRIVLDEPIECHGQVVIAGRMGIAFRARTIEPDDRDVRVTFGKGDDFLQEFIHHQGHVNHQEAADFEKVCDFSIGRF